MVYFMALCKNEARLYEPQLLKDPKVVSLIVLFILGKTTRKQGWQTRDQTL
jgi:hypothetical protein